MIKFLMSLEAIVVAFLPLARDRVRNSTSLHPFLIDLRTGAEQRICLRPNTEPILWEILPVERNLKEPLWFTQLLPSTR